MKYSALIDELHAFHGANGGRVCINQDRLTLTERLKKYMDDFASAHPDASAFFLRGKIYELIAIVNPGKWTAV